MVTAIRRVSVVVLAALLMLTACAEPEKGTVYGRWFYPEYQWIQMVCSLYDKASNCVMQIPTIRTEPARWSLGLREGEDEGQRSVTEREYGRCQVGDRYPDCVR